MSINPTTLQIKVTETDTVTSLLYPASKKNRLGITLILGHGAGANQSSGFMRLFANGLAERGLDVMTFNFVYSERGRGAPDTKAKLEACYERVIEAATKHKKLTENKVAIGGKSMGGRIGSQVAAADASNISALVFLGYPLHPPGNLEKMRDAHLPNIKAPMLFLQGARDTFGTTAELRAVIKKHKLPATLYEIAGGDHSFKVPKSVGLTQEEVYELAMNEIARWLQVTLRDSP
ncbi:MAG TPA: alpha/beta fold hydrolase [Pyrinomonadaceae bacterium]|nr:alpha/beta fold hydrolase [Pyrinomonadaceae bacterium]